MSEGPGISDGALEINGGATLASGGPPLNVGIPLARLHADRDQVSILIRPRWFGKFLAKLELTSDIDGIAGWSASWEEIDQVVATRRTVFFVPRAALGARFVVMSRRRLAPLHQLIASKGIPVDHVFTTIGKTFRT